MNRVPESQNEELQLERLAAQRYLYSCSKRLLGVQVLLSGPVAAAWALAMIWRPELKGFATLWGVTITLCDLSWLNPYQVDWRERAAKIQEQFDCDVLSLPWNRIKAGDPPTPEEVHENAEKQVRTDTGSPALTDWYPPEGGCLPLAVARILCQRFNCWWDSKQRRRYSQALGVIAVGALVAIIWVFFASDVTLPNFFLKVAGPALPIAVIGVRHWREQREAAARLENLRRHAERLWNEALTGSDEAALTNESRQLQDEIFQNRKSNPPVFDWLYARLQPAAEMQMRRSAGDLIEEWQRKQK